MLIKFLTRSSKRPALHQLIQYVNQGKEYLAANTDFILTNIPGETTAKGVSRHFVENNKLIKKRRGKQVAAYHIVLSWHPDERKFLDNETLLTFAKKFYQLYDGDRALSFITVHRDTDNWHLHCAFSASERGSGKNRRISKAALRDLQIEMNEFQRDHFPHLDKSLLYLPGLKRNQKKILGEIEVTLPEKLRHPDGSYRAKKRGDASVLESLRHRLYTIAKKHPSRESFLYALERQTDLKPYLYRDKPRGIITPSGKKYTYRRLAIDDLNHLSRFVRAYEMEKLREKSLEQSKSITLER